MSVVDREEAALQVKKMANMLASLYYHFSREVIERLGEEEGRKLIAKVIENYGRERGGQHRENCLKAGLEVRPENYGQLPDVPSLGWEFERVEKGENPSHIRITKCPLAKYWIEKGFSSVGRLYCQVDQAKHQAYHPDSCLVHLANVLDGDEYCEMVVRR
ncbi:MAG: L-2-amino-thiazoline-4-carboxylic acid hydrolase [Bacillota bacterium]